MFKQVATFQNDNIGPNFMISFGVSSGAILITYFVHIECLIVVNFSLWQING